jgi:RNA-binding protein
MEGLDKRKLAEARKRAQRIQASVHVGRDGVTEGTCIEIRKQLKNRTEVKVKLLPSVKGDRREVAEMLATATGTHLVEVRGRTVVLSRK